MARQKARKWPGILSSPLFPPRHTLTGALLGKRQVAAGERERWIRDATARIDALFIHFGLAPVAPNWNPEVTDYALLVMRLCEQLRIPGFLPPPATKENIRDTPEAANARADLLALVESEKGRRPAGGPKVGDLVALKSILKKSQTPLPNYYRVGKKKAGLASLRADVSRARKERAERQRLADMLRSQYPATAFNLGLGFGAPVPAPLGGGLLGLPDKIP